jgi:polysaccharide chain length determinant protein (PEP-CTERM system associated)
MVHQEIGAKDVVAIVKRRFWLIFLLTLFGGAAGFGAARVLPKRYVSKTLVLVEQPEVQPVTPVAPNATDNVNQRLATMQQQILSTARLEPVIRDLNLYQEDINRLSMEEIVERLRQAITITPVAPMAETRAQNLPGFTISVVFGNPQTAQQICAMITSMFVQENIAVTTTTDAGTTKFLNDQLDQAKAKLDEQDAKLAGFQRRYVGSLPEDSQANLNLLNGQTSQLDAATQAVNRAQQDKSFAESILAQQLSSWKASQTGQNPETADQQLQALQTQLIELQSKYTNDHPDVIKAKHDIAVLKQKMAESEQQRKIAAVPEKSTVPAAEPTQILQLRAQIHQYDQVIKERSAQQDEIKKQIAIYQARVAASPGVEQEYKLLTRDHQTVLDTYNELLKKRDASAMSQQFDQTKQNDRFHVLDPANLANEPSFPKLPLFAGGGFGGGLLLAVGLSLLLEMHDTSMRSEHDVEVVLHLPVLAMIPVIAQHSGKVRPQPSISVTYKSKEHAKV